MKTEKATIVPESDEENVLEDAEAALKELGSVSPASSPVSISELLDSPEERSPTVSDDCRFKEEEVFQSLNIKN